MAGTIIADFIRTDANQLSLNVGNTTFATINASGFFSNTGTQLIAANGKVSGASLVSGSITSAAFATAANTIPRSSMTIGAVLQTVANTSITGSTSANAVALTLSITPSSASSRILILGALEGERVGGSSGNYIFGQLRKNTTNLRGFINAAGYQQTTGARNFNTLMFIDSPATTSAITYDIWIDHTTTGAASGITWNWYNGSIYALEIAS